MEKARRYIYILTLPLPHASPCVNGDENGLDEWPGWEAMGTGKSRHTEQVSGAHVQPLVGAFGIEAVCAPGPAPGVPQRQVNIELPR
jgi:hypothetical protein